MSRNDIRSLIAWDPEKETSIAHAFIATLTMNEHAPDETDAMIYTTIGEIRNHVQWCQQAARLVDTGAEAQTYFIAMEQNLHTLQRHISSLEHMLQSAGVDPPAKPALRKYAASNPQRRA